MSENIEFLIATMNRRSLLFLEKMFAEVGISNISALVINQCTEIEPPTSIAPPHRKIRVISIKDRGLSKSRNLAINNSMGEICLIGDDDVVYPGDILNKLDLVYEDQQLDLATGMAQTTEKKKLRRKYAKKKHRHRWLTITQVCSWEISFRRSRIIDSGLVFDEDFGLGSRKYVSGEENIFLLDALRAGLSVEFVPEVFVRHPEDSSGYILDESSARTKGAMFYRMFNYLPAALLADLMFTLKRLLLIRKSYTARNFLYNILRGSFEYRRRKIAFSRHGLSEIED